jgi:UDP-galactopyranose mutase
LDPSRSISVRSDVIVCFSHLRWKFVYQRPQHLLSRAAAGSAVLFVEEPVWVGDAHAPQLRAEQAGPVRRLWPELPHRERADAGCTAQRALIEGLLAQAGAHRRIGWFYTPMALRFVDPAAFDLIVYDCMDELSGFAGADPGLAALEQQLLQAADVVFAGGRSLFESKKRTRPDVRLEPSSVDAAHFAAARDWSGPEPQDQAGIAGPRLGWFGVIDERMDLALLDATAALRPDWAFVMIGPVVKIDPATLPRRPNLHWLGAKDYADLPAYLAGWSCGVMPFGLNAATRFISPTKTPEYLAAGLPVVSTPVADVVTPWGEAGLVEIAEDAQGIAAAAARAMARPRGRWLAQVDAALSELSWDKTWARMRAAIRNAERPAPAAAAAGGL